MKRLILTSSCTSRGLSYLLQTRCKISVNGLIKQQHLPLSKSPITSVTPVRFLSSSGGGGGGGGGGSNDNDDGDNDSNKDAMSDPFGVDFDDGDDLVGPTNQLPPNYKRDSATGKLTGDVEAELTAEELEKLKMGPIERDRFLLKQVVESWKTEQEGGQGDNEEAVAGFARRVRLAKMALNVLGRSVKAQGAKTTLDYGEEFGRDEETGFTQHLTQGEFQTFQKFMMDHHKVHVTEDDIPVHADRDSDSTTNKRYGPLDDDDIAIQGITDDNDADPDNPDLSLKWMTSRAKWEVSKRYGAEHPFDEMLPQDLRVQRLVNRKRAKKIPDELMHHNNLPLLRRYISPAGQIMHRSRTRLGARDQRRIARLIKRARKLGLIPHTGQFKIETHGCIYEKDIHVKKPWEEELERRGLVIPPFSRKQQQAKSEEKE